MTWFVPPRVPITDKSGFITREWFLFLQGVFDATNASQAGLAINDVSPNPATVESMALSSILDQSPPSLQADQNLLNLDQGPSFYGLRDQVAALELAVDDLRKGTVSI